MKFKLNGNYFGNHFHESPTSGQNRVERFIKRECPADINTILWECPINYKHVDPVLDSAEAGYRTWRNTSAEERISYLKRYQEQVVARKDDLALAIALEAGKPLWEAHTEVSAIIAKVDVTVNDSLPRIDKKTYENILPNTKGHLFYKPLGPTLVIGPFNFPCHLANGQILNSLIAGNSIIFKPSEKTAYSADVLMQCFAAAEFPKGVVNLIQGDGEIARRVLKDKRIKGIYFTGSKEVGLKVLEETYRDVTKLVALELGGKNPAIVHKDCNIDHALNELVTGCYLTTGQRCTSTSIVVIHDDIKDEFISKFHELSKRVIIDHPVDFDKEPLMGPLIDQKSVDNYLNFIGMAKREGIEEVMRGKQLEKKHKGYYVSPSIHYTNRFNPQSHFLTSELFGPNCTFISYNDIEEAIDIANSTEFGLAASVFSGDRAIYEKCAHEVETGLINFNRSTCGASSRLPFGGVKNSGNYHPMAVATIDACVYQMSGLELEDIGNVELGNIKGVQKI